MRIAFILFYTTFFYSIYAQSSDQMMPINDLKSNMLRNPKKIIVVFEKENCNWCDQISGLMDTYLSVTEYLQETFYITNLDVFYDRDITFNGSVYTGNKSEPHELASVLAQNRISFPMMVFLDEEYRVLQSLAGIQNDTKLARILYYFGDDHFKNVPWSKFSELTHGDIDKIATKSKEIKHY